MDDWDSDDFGPPELDGFLDWDEDEESDMEIMVDAAHDLSASFFLNSYSEPISSENYSLGHLDAEEWWPLVWQIDEMVDLEVLAELTADLAKLLPLPGLPTELLEDPLSFLDAVLDGELPREPSGRKVNSRRLIKIARLVVRIAQEVPAAARAAVTAWANLQRHQQGAFPPFEPRIELADLLGMQGLPPALRGFGMLIAMTLMRWPERTAELPLPPPPSDPQVFMDLLRGWEQLPDSTNVTAEGTGQAEDLFAQGQIAHLLGQIGAAGDAHAAVEDGPPMPTPSQLSRAMLWVHGQCRHCPKRVGVACEVATTSRSGGPVPLVDVAAELASTGRIAGCIHDPGPPAAGRGAGA